MQKITLSKLKNINFFGSLTSKDQIFFAKRLAFLIKAGVAIHDALNLIKEQTSSKKYRKVLENLVSRVSEGASLSKAMSASKRDFGDFSINIISVGEEAGVLAENLNYLSEELEKRESLRKKIIGALLYPFFISIATLLITVVLTIFIFPKIAPIFASLNTNLPFSTKTMIWVSNFLSESWFIIFLLLFLITVGAAIAAKKSQKFRNLFHRNLLRLPFIGKILLNYNLANLSRTLSLLLKSGMTLGEAVAITSRSLQNVSYKGELKQIETSVNRGEKISEYIKKNKKLFPEIFSSLIAIGERSGNLSETLFYLSEWHENEVNESTKNLSSLLEPVLMLIMGLIVGFIAVSVITPIYGITQHLGPR